MTDVPSHPATKLQAGGSPLTVDDLRQLESIVRQTFREQPPTIGVVGVSGVGKSSTINALFKQNLRTSDTVRCTTEFERVDLSVTANTTEVKGIEARLRVYDAPGLGEDIERDPYYLQMYRDNLPQCDVILWIMAARNRAVALDQLYLRELAEFSDRMVFGINQVDLVEPIDWNHSINLPSQAQENNIREIIADRESRIASILRRNVTVAAFGAKEKYRLVELFSHMIDACPPDRRWIFDSIRKVRPEDFLKNLPESARRAVLDAARRASPADRRDAYSLPRAASEQKGTAQGAGKGIAGMFQSLKVRK